MSYSEHFDRLRLAHQKAVKNQRRWEAKSGHKKATIMSGLFLAICGMGWLMMEYEDVLPNISVSLFTKSAAQSADTAISTTKESENKNNNQSQAPLVVEESSLTSLVERDQQLKAKEQELKRLEVELQNQQQELNRKIEQLAKMREEISQMLQSQSKEDAQKIDLLVDVYSTMKPAQAAKVFEEMEEELVVKILEKMKKKNAAEILNFIKPEKVKVFSERVTGYRITKTGDK